MLHARQLLSAGDQAYAEDVVQELFVKLLAQASSPGRLPMPGNPAAWLHTCVRNAAGDARRASARRRQRENEAGHARRPWFQSNADDLLDAALAQSALESLPESIREVVVLRIWSDLTLADIAAVVEVPVSTVHDRYQKGLAMVRRILERRTTHVRTILP